ncbi:MAG: NAD(P)/FAD-dependent oxidoreductase [Candidatus Kapaibacterium sp.]|nr:MAG: NAD(P)/FAD-dependent oxidoreductase [Candidatus Kapabacteria bacterium]
MLHIIIIGNGIAGITAARHIRKRSNHRITIVSSESTHFFSRPALMYIYMGHLTYEQTKPYHDDFWEKNRIELVHDHAHRIDTEAKAIHLQSGTQLRYDKLIVATGSIPRRLGWKGQDLQGVQGLYSLQDLQSMIDISHHIKRAVIVGGGLIGVETAEMLYSRGIPTTFLVRESRYWNSVLPNEEAEMIGRHIQEHKSIELRTNTELQEILDDGTGRVRGIVTNAGEEIPCEFVALTVGVEPNVALARASGIPVERGIVVNEFFASKIPDVYACGDCAEMQHSSDAARGRIEPLWYAARAHGECLAANICGEQHEYTRTTFFNSAKFFDIEYQTYGTVSAKLGENEATIFWQDSPSAATKRLLRIVYAKDATKRVVGCNVLNVRYRQDVCTHWIERGASIEEVLENLGAANFDPEFFAQAEAHLVAEYNRQEGKNLVLKKRRSLWNALQILSSSTA